MAAPFSRLKWSGMQSCPCFFATDFFCFGTKPCYWGFAFNLKISNVLFAITHTHTHKQENTHMVGSDNCSCSVSSVGVIFVLYHHLDGLPRRQQQAASAVSINKQVPINQPRWWHTGDGKTLIKYTVPAGVQLVCVQNFIVILRSQFWWFCFVLHPFLILFSVRNRNKTGMTDVWWVRVTNEQPGLVFM